MATSSVRTLRLAPSAELWSFAVIGALCTAAYAILYTLLRHGGVAPGAANALSLAATMGANFAANRRFTFDATSGPLGRQLRGYAIAYLIGLAVSSLALAALLGPDFAGGRVDHLERDARVVLHLALLVNLAKRLPGLFQFLAGWPVD